MAKKTTPEWLVFGAGFVDITLSRPAKMSGAEVTVVRMREPLVADQEVAAELDGTDATREILTFANLLDQAPADVRQLPIRDYRRLSTAYLTFID